MPPTARPVRAGRMRWIGSAMFILEKNWTLFNQNWEDELSIGNVLLDLEVQVLPLIKTAVVMRQGRRSGCSDPAHEEEPITCGQILSVTPFFGRSGLGVA